MKINITPLHDRIIVQPDPTETVTKTGIYIPENVQEKPQYGTVAAVGPGRFSEQTGVPIPISVKIGDRVTYGKFTGTEITIDKVDYLIMREPDIYAVL